MNRKFNGIFIMNPYAKNQRGSKSKAAKAAFNDILADKDMRVHSDSMGIDRKVSTILNETNILNYE